MQYLHVCILPNDQCSQNVIMLICACDGDHNYHHTVKDFVQLLTHSVCQMSTILFKNIGSLIQKGFLSLCQAVTLHVNEIASYHPTKIKQKNYHVATCIISDKLRHVGSTTTGIWCELFTVYL